MDKSLFEYGKELLGIDHPSLLQSNLGFQRQCERRAIEEYYRQVKFYTEARQPERAILILTEIVKYLQDIR